MKTSIENLNEAFMKVLDEYKNACDENADEAIQYTAKEAVQELRKAHPSGSGRYGSWKDYNKSWTIKKNTVDKRAHRGATIHNAGYYQLTHLLENGHALPQGGRSRSYKHILPVAEKAEEQLVKRMTEGL